MAALRKNKRSIYTSLNKVRLIRGGKPYFDYLLEMINTAKETIHLQTYIFDDDETGRMVADALITAARRKVTVYVLVDGFGSGGALSNEFIKDLTDSGIHFRFFEPLLRTKHFYFGRRLHHKMVVTDIKYALVGGINITNRYNDMPDQKAWLDFALTIEGEAAKELCVLCWKSWNNYPAVMGATSCEQKQLSYDIPSGKGCEVAVRRNDWVRRKNEISSTYIGMFRNAQSHIIILCSYFLPGRIIRNQMAAAARRGVKIKIITAGSSDIKIAKYAERYMYDWLLRNNMEIYEYNEGVLHGKIAVCDGEWYTIGSYNLNNLSAYASIELNINVRNADCAKSADQILLDIASRNCTPITREYQLRTTNVFKRFARWCSYEGLRLMLYLSTFYYRRHKE